MLLNKKAHEIVYMFTLLKSFLRLPQPQMSFSQDKEGPVIDLLLHRTDVRAKQQTQKSILPCSTFDQYKNP